ncbi:MAG: glyoxalase superfamily protein [Flavobacteriaceae bacterium]
MKKATLTSVHPVLPVWDVSLAMAFYVDKLGFVLAFSDVPKAPTYAGVRRDGVELHLQWHDPKEWEHTVDRPMLRFMVPQIEVLYHEYAARDVFHSQTALRDTAWGTREFAFYDPFKNGLTFYRDL